MSPSRALILASISTMAYLAMCYVIFLPLLPDALKPMWAAGSPPFSIVASFSSLVIFVIIDRRSRSRR